MTADDWRAPNIRCALDALDGIRADWAGVEVTGEGWVVVTPYWAPEVVDPDGRPIGTAREHRAQWERVTEALEGVGWEPARPDEMPMGQLLSECSGRMHGGWPVVFRYVWGEE